MKTEIFNYKTNKFDNVDEIYGFIMKDNIKNVGNWKDKNFRPMKWYEKLHKWITWKLFKLIFK
jgi:hypothetical protein